MPEEDRLKWIYSSRSNQELSERYDGWADTYDQDIEEGYGWQIPGIMAGMLSRLIQKPSRILDAGAGTGLVGLYLKEEGFHDLVAMDISREMLNKAREKNIYREFHQMALGDNLDFEDGSFDAVVCAGVLTFSHAPARSLYELARITRQGGYILFSIRTDAFQSMGFPEICGELRSEGKWKLSDSQKHQSFTRKEEDVVHDIYVYEVL